MAQAPTEYDDPNVRIDRQQPSGTKVSLKLQLRTKTEENESWFVVSWRDQYSPSGSNRQYYIVKGEVWSIDAALALEMYEELERRGGLDERYDDLKRRPSFDVNSAHNEPEELRTKLFEEITMPNETWGRYPFVIILNDPNDDWRKSMIVNRETGHATFRSTTTDENYKLKQKMREGTEWYLDRSMQDVNVQQAREFLKQLRKIVPTLQ